jgi:hypothetical protein
LDDAKIYPIDDLAGGFKDLFDSQPYYDLNGLCPDFSGG